MKSGVTHLLLHPTGMYPSDIPAQVCTETTYPFPARIILSSANANAGYYKQYTKDHQPFGTCRFSSVVYPYCILNSSTHLLACHAVSRLIIAQNISSITRLGSIIPHQVFNALALTLFVFRVLTDYSDTTFSSNNFAFFTNWFN